MLTERHENAPGRYVLEPGCNFKRACLWGQRIPCSQVVFWHKKVDSAYFWWQQSGGKVIYCLYICICISRYWLHAYTFAAMFICNYMAYLCPIVMALCSTFGFWPSGNNIRDANMCYYIYTLVIISIFEIMRVNWQSCCVQFFFLTELLHGRPVIVETTRS